MDQGINQTLKNQKRQVKEELEEYLKQGIKQIKTFMQLKRSDYLTKMKMKMIESKEK